MTGTEYDDPRDLALAAELTQLWMTQPDPLRSADARSAAVEACGTRSPWRRRVTATAVTVAVAGLGTVGAAAASQGSLPGDPTYGLKRGLEQARVALAFGDEAEARAWLTLAQARLDEAIAAQTQDRPEAVSGIVTGYLEAVAEVRAELAEVEQSEPEAAVISEVARTLSVHQDVLTGLLSDVPEPARLALERAIRATESGPASAGVGAPLDLGELFGETPVEHGPATRPTPPDPGSRDRPGSGREPGSKPSAPATRPPSSTSPAEPEPPAPAPPYEGGPGSGSDGPGHAPTPPPASAPGGTEGAATGGSALRATEDS